MKTYPRASHSDKFPGISISMFSEKSSNFCTPEIYLRRYYIHPTFIFVITPFIIIYKIHRGAFIIPGVKSPSDLAECCAELNKVYHLFKIGKHNCNRTLCFYILYSCSLYLPQFYTSIHLCVYASTFMYPKTPQMQTPHPSKSYHTRISGTCDCLYCV